MLQKHNFEYIQLEDFSLSNKIKIFMESEIIVSSHSGSLTFTLFANIKSTKQPSFTDNESHFT